MSWERDALEAELHHGKPLSGGLEEARELDAQRPRPRRATAILLDCGCELLVPWRFVGAKHNCPEHGELRQVLRWTQTDIT